MYILVSKFRFLEFSLILSQLASYYIAQLFDFKHTSFIKFSLTNQKLGAREKLPYLKKKGEIPPKSYRILMKIIPLDSAY